MNYFANMRKLSLVSLLVAVLIQPSARAVPPISNPALNPQAEQLLKKACGTYVSAKTLSLRLLASLTRESQAKTENREYFIVTEKPNKYYVMLHSDHGGSAVSDGKNVEYYVNFSNKYMVSAAPPSFDDGFSQQEFGLVTGETIDKSLLPQLLGPHAYEELTSRATELKQEGKDKIGDQDCDHLALVRGGYTTDIWLTPGKAPMIAKVRWNLAKAPSQSKTALTFEYKNQVLNMPVQPAKFDAPHPTNATKVAAFIMTDPGQKVIHDLIGKPAPNIVLRMQDGSSIKLANLKDRVVVLDFWATWCPPCVRSMPVFAMESQKFKSQGVMFIPVNQGENKEQVNAFMKSNHLPMLCALDTDDSVGRLFHTDAIPETVFIGKDGTIKGIHVGIGPDFKDRFNTDLSDVIAGKVLREEAH